MHSFKRRSIIQALAASATAYSGTTALTASAVLETSRSLQYPGPQPQVLDGSDSKQVIWQALQTSGLLDQIVKTAGPPDVDRLWLDGDGRSATLRRWDEVLRVWTPITLADLSLTGSVQTLEVFGGSGDEIFVSSDHPPAAGGLYWLKPAADNVGPAVIRMKDGSRFPITRHDGSTVVLGDLTAGNRALFFLGNRFELLYADTRRSTDEQRLVSEHLSRAEVIADFHPEVAPEAIRTAGYWTVGDGGGRCTGEPLPSPHMKVSYQSPFEHIPLQFGMSLEKRRFVRKCLERRVMAIPPVSLALTTWDRFKLR